MHYSITSTLSSSFFHLFSLFFHVPFLYYSYQTRDIYLFLRPFVPATGRLLSVKLYLSDFGAQMIETDTTYGPAHVMHLIEKLKTQNAASDGETHTDSADDEENEDSSDSDGKKKKKSSSSASSSLLKDDGPSKLEEMSTVTGAQTVKELKEAEKEEMEKLREYEASKLRYFYAIAETDSPQTALELYNSSDHVEIQHTGNILDLRFVPEDMTFEREPAFALFVLIHFIMLILIRILLFLLLVLSPHLLPHTHSIPQRSLHRRRCSACRPSALSSAIFVFSGTLSHACRLYMGQTRRKTAESAHSQIHRRRAR